jgi:ATP-dependent DNA ligase
LDGADIRRDRIEERRERLKRLVEGILFSEAIAAEGAVAFAKACEMGLEGIVLAAVISPARAAPG